MNQAFFSGYILHEKVNSIMRKVRAKYFSYLYALLRLFVNLGFICRWYNHFPPFLRLNSLKKTKGGWVGTELDEKRNGGEDICYFESQKKPSGHMNQLFLLRWNYIMFCTLIKVEFFSDASLLHIVKNVAYSYSWQSLGNVIYIIK